MKRRPPGPPGRRLLCCVLLHVLKPAETARKDDPPELFRCVRAWHEGPPPRYVSRSKYSLRDWARWLAYASQTQELLYELPPQCRHPQAGPPAPGPRRLPPTPPSIRRPGLASYNSVLCPPRQPACHARCYPGRGKAGRGSGRARRSWHPSRHALSPHLPIVAGR
jgi:hypothetical protein